MGMGAIKIDHLMQLFIYFCTRVESTNDVKNETQVDAQREVLQNKKYFYEKRES